MSNYTKTTNFAAKDSLPSGNSGKIVKGTEIDTEFDNIQTAIATKADIAGPTFTGTVTIPTVDLNGGAIDGTTVGASTAAAITGTTIVANTSINIAGDGATVTGIKDEDDMSSNSATKLATQQSIKAYVDSQVTAQDLDFQADSGGALSIDLDSETLTFTGGTGVDTSGSGNAVTFAIDSTVATLTGTQTLTNKTLTSPTLNTPTIGTSFTIGSATITEAELEILDGATVTTAELNVLDGITSTTAELNILDGVTSTAAELNILDGVTATTAELNIMDGVTATTAEINYVDGVTSNVQTQLDAKAPIASPTFTGTVTVPGLTTSADILFGDNDKAIFGAGSDLQIYHDGSHSYVSDQGTGNLRVLAENFQVRNPANNEAMIIAIPDSGVTLYHDNSTKLSTTSTGIDVTGTVTADGLTVNSGATSTTLNFQNSGTAYSTLYNDTNGVVIFSADAGNTGSAPRMQLNVGGQQAFRITDGGDISFYEDTGTTPKLFWDASAESLGIGTSSVNYKLNVLADAGSQNIFQAGQTGVSNGLSITSDGSALTYSFLTGNVGIGTSSPSTALHVNSGNTNDVATFESSDANAKVTIKDNTTTNFITANAGRMVVSADSANAVANSYMAFEVDDSEAVRIDSSGNLLVGTTGTPNGTSVYGSGFFNTGASGLVQWLSATSTATTVSVARFYNPNGNVGSIQLNGSATSYVTSSDQRLKENIADADDAGSKVDAIQVRKFDWIADGSHQDYGMIAQELQAVAPEAVSAPEDPEDMMGVDYSKLVPMLVKEIQSLRARVAQLES